MAAWRDAYRAYGAKPQRTRNSLEALTRRAPAGLPRVNRLTDLYNALSVLHQIPLGGEDLTRYTGSPRLLRATGEEQFETAADGVPAVEHPDPGEVVWCDDAGGDLPALELATVAPDPAHRRDHLGVVHPRRPGPDDRRSHGRRNR